MPDAVFLGEPGHAPAPPSVTHSSIAFASSQPPLPDAASLPLHYVHAQRVIERLTSANRILRCQADAYADALFLHGLPLPDDDTQSVRPSRPRGAVIPPSTSATSADSSDDDCRSDEDERSVGSAPSTNSAQSAANSDGDEHSSADEPRGVASADAAGEGGAVGPPPFASSLSLLPSTHLIHHHIDHLTTLLHYHHFAHTQPIPSPPASHPPPPLSPTPTPSSSSLPSSLLHQLSSAVQHVQSDALAIQSDLALLLPATPGVQAGGEEERRRVRGLEGLVREQERTMRAMRRELDVLWGELERREREDRAHGGEAAADDAAKAAREQWRARRKAAASAVRIAGADAASITRLMDSVLQHVHDSSVQAQVHVEELKRITAAQPLSH